ncbi:S-adenosyl methyltransferase [Actinokineospora iranica]|uniref:S-adenosyl methyltransferase n=1 Tax=Actinokineospora iranica TaxID=1271860 RepID=A0A1G6U0T2_9PSEU|nr:S-adenosyl methyltransferase [Actinokineospora iranica]
MIGQGVRQFLDLGSDIPTTGNVHEIAHAADRTAESSTSTMTRWPWPTAN